MEVSPLWRDKGPQGHGELAGRGETMEGDSREGGHRGTGMTEEMTMITKIRVLRN